MTNVNKMLNDGGGGPLTTISSEEAQAKYKELAGKTLPVIEKEHDSFLKTMKQAADQAGEDFDLSKITVLSGANVEEKYKAFVSLHSKLSGATQALSEARSLMNTKRFIVKDDNDDEVQTGIVNPQGGRPSVFQKPGAISRAVEQAMEARGTSLSDFEAPMNIVLDPAGEEDVVSAVFMTPGRMAASFTTSAGYDPEIIRQPGVVLSAQNFPTALDIFPIVPVTVDGVAIMQESTYSASNAGTKAEEATAGEVALAVTEVTFPVRRISAFLPVTEEVLQDAGPARRYLDIRLPNMIRNVLENQLFLGNGTAPNLAGVGDYANVNNQAIVAASFSMAGQLVSEMFDGMYDVYATGKARASHYALSNGLWKQIVLSKDSDAQFYYGGPVAGPEQRLWGLPVASSFEIPYAASSNIGFVGDFMNSCYIGLRHDVRVEMGLNNDDFTKFRNSIRASVRAAFVMENQRAFTHFSVASGVTLP